MKASDVLAALAAIATPGAVADVARFYRAEPGAGVEGNRIMGVSIGRVFPIARQFTARVAKLLDSRFHEVRMAPVSVMDLEARARSRLLSLSP